MYAGLIAGYGSGLAAISNLAQIGESLGYDGNIQVRPQLRTTMQGPQVLPIEERLRHRGLLLQLWALVIQALSDAVLGPAGVHVPPQRLAVPGAAGQWFRLRVSTR